MVRDTKQIEIASQWVEDELRDHGFKRISPEATVERLLSPDFFSPVGLGSEPMNRYHRYGQLQRQVDQLSDSEIKMWLQGQATGRLGKTAAAGVVFAVATRMAAGESDFELALMGSIDAATAHPAFEATNSQDYRSYGFPQTTMATNVFRLVTIERSDWTPQTDIIAANGLAMLCDLTASNTDMYGGDLLPLPGATA